MARRELSNNKQIFTLLVFITFVVAARGYLPVLLMHGYTGSNNDFNTMVERIQKVHPGTIAISLPLYNNKESEINPMWVQVNGVREYIQNLIENNSSFANGFHVIGHSQGSLIMRSVIETWPNHTIVNYISLAGPHLGEYGLVGPFLMKEAWRVLYTPKLQAHYSVAGYWHDPQHTREFLESSLFLPYVNNLIPPSYNESYKEAFLRLNVTSLLGSPDDGEIYPWESTVFGYYRINSTEIIDNITLQYVYQEDTFGLKSAYETGKILIHTPPGVQHTDWLTNPLLFHLYIEPLLT